MPQRVSNIDLSPRKLLQNSASPQGPLPAPRNAQGSSESSRVASVSLIQNTINQVNTSRVNGVGGKVDLLG